MQPIDKFMQLTNLHIEENIDVCFACFKYIDITLLHADDKK